MYTEYGKIYAFYFRKNADRWSKLIINPPIRSHRIHRKQVLETRCLPLPLQTGLSPGEDVISGGLLLREQGGWPQRPFNKCPVNRSPGRKSNFGPGYKSGGE